jgi:hypothetical protein
MRLILYTWLVLSVLLLLVTGDIRTLLPAAVALAIIIATRA